MKKIVLTFIVSLLLLPTIVAQNMQKAFSLTNSLWDLWYEGKTEKAVENSLELFQLKSLWFIERIHEDLPQILLGSQRQKNGITYLEKLRLQNNEEINKITFPIYLWSRALSVKEEHELLTIKQELENFQKDNSNYESKMERYYILIVKELFKKNVIDNEELAELVNKNISNLEIYPNINAIVTDRKEAEKRAWYRCILAYNYDYLYSNVSNKEEYLEKASNYSPDLNDRLNNSAYFYDAAFLTGIPMPKQFGYKSKYQKYLADNNRKIEALNLLCEITFDEPSDNNIRSLKEYYLNSNKIESFNTFWKKFINTKGKAVPKVKIQFENEILDLTHETGFWIYIDVWGTWCGSCRKELPELESIYLENKEVEDSKLRIYTFSVNSKHLSDFMVENKYTFPVSEINEQTNNLFEVSGYPTKILISPEGNYIKIPYGVDWKTYIKNYTLL